MRVLLNVLLYPVVLVIVVISGMIKAVKSLLVRDHVSGGLAHIEEQRELFELMSAMNAGGCTTDEIPEGIGDFGLAPSNPIPTHTVQGSILYLNGLRTEDGARINYERLGSTGAENIAKPIDEYLVTHQNGYVISKIYISPYQLVNSKKAPRGLGQVSPLL